MGPEGQGIPRSTFLSWLGHGLGGTLFGTLLFGFGNKYNYQVKKIKLKFNNIPDAFKGMRMVHISDIHSGSFQDIRAVNKGIDLILKQQADIIVFTGDLVNDRATEMEPYQNSFARLAAPLGVFLHSVIMIMATMCSGLLHKLKWIIWKPSKKYMPTWDGVY